MSTGKIHADTGTLIPPDSFLSRTIHALRKCLSSKNGKRKCLALLFPFLVALLLPLANILFIYPSFIDVIIKGIEVDAKRLGHHMLPPSIKHTELKPGVLSHRFFGDIYKLENDFGLMKIKIFSSAGEVLYSTEPTDVGHLNTKPYFKDVVVKGGTFTKLIVKDARSLEGEKINIDVVETYVPFMHEGKFLGAFEMYYDITKRKKRLDQLVAYSGWAMGILALCLILTVIVLLRKEIAHQRAKEREEKLRAEVERIAQHDVKSPLIGIHSGIQYLEQFTELTQEQASILVDIQDATDTAMDMVNRSLDLYKMESGTYEYNPTDMDMLGVVKRAKDALSSLAMAKGVEVFITQSGTIPGDGANLPCRAEEPLCYSLISNLLKNAIEASTPGDRATIAISDEDGIKLTFHNPAMVPVEVQDTFFDKLSTAGKSGGTGLGTYSALLMTEVMGGTISMSTSETDGTLVTVTLPPPQETEPKE